MAGKEILNGRQVSSFHTKAGKQYSNGRQARLDSNAGKIRLKKSRQETTPRQQARNDSKAGK
jgi:hypothetical protein